MLNVTSVAFLWLRESINLLRENPKTTKYIVAFYRNLKMLGQNGSDRIKIVE